MWPGRKLVKHINPDAEQLFVDALQKELGKSGLYHHKVTVNPSILAIIPALFKLVTTAIPPMIDPASAQHVALALHRRISEMCHRKTGQTIAFGRRYDAPMRRVKPPQGDYMLKSQFITLEGFFSMLINSRGGKGIMANVIAKVKSMGPPRPPAH